MEKPTMTPTMSIRAGVWRVVMVWAVGVVAWCGVARGQTASALWDTQSPSVRSGQAMAYDSARGVVVMFGGGSSTPYLNDTWEWDGVSWKREYIGGPPARTNHAMAYDSMRGVTVLFGGDSSISNASGGKLNDTWEWDGTTWRLVASGGPTPRSRSSLAFDSLHGKTVLFSGEAYPTNRPADTWEWDGTAWAQRQPSVSPPGTHSHSLSYDSARNVVVLTGGLWMPGDYGTWEWNGATWARRSTVTSGYGYPMAFDSARQVSIRNGQKWNGTAWSGVPLVTPRPAASVWTGSMAFDSARGVLVLLGTRTASDGVTVVTETWEWNGTSWANRTPTEPWGRHDHAMAFDSGRGVAVMFGGMGTLGAFTVPFGDTWEWNGSSWSMWMGGAPNTPPGAIGPAMAYDRARGVTTMFGGRDAQNMPLGATWAWDGNAWIDRGVAGPSARAWPAMAYDSARGVTVLFGGRDGFDVSLGDTWEWNGTSWMFRATGGPEPRSEHVMAYDSARGVVIMHGGITLFGFSTRFADTWAWDGNSWTKLAATGPSARNGSSMAFDSGRGVAVLNGGRGGAATPFGDTGEWNGTQWTRTGTVTTTYGSTNPPGIRTNAAMVFDDVRRELVMFGGTPGTPSSDTWLFRTGCISPAFTPASTQTVRACRGSTVTLHAAPTGTGLSYLWYKGSAGLGTGPTGTGSTVGDSDTPTLTIAHVGAADTAGYFCRVNNECGIADSPAFSVRVCVADYNCSGTITIDDVFDYVNGWLNGDPLADLDGNGLSVQDLLTFINAWFVGRLTAGCQ